MKIYSSIFALFLFSALGALAQGPRESDWIPLFNGKDLTGWKKNGDEKWIVEQGTILCESTANKYGYLTTEKTYRDFILRLKFKGEAAGNSGVFLHSKILGTDPQHGPDIEGMQVEVDPGGFGAWRAHCYTAQRHQNCGLYGFVAQIRRRCNRFADSYRRRCESAVEGHLYSGAVECVGWF